jgi:hypothetical protein
MTFTGNDVRCSFGAEPHITEINQTPAANKMNRDLIERRKPKWEKDVANMYNAYNNPHIEKQKEEMEKNKEEERKKSEQIRRETDEYLKQTTTTGFGVKGRSHPLYRTTNSVYGSKKVSELHRPLQYHGQNGAFTKEFVGGMYRNHSLNTNRTRNSSLPDPSFGTNEWFEQRL